MTIGNTTDSQTIRVPISVGSRVALLEDVDMEESGSAGTIMFDRVVEQYVPESNKLAFYDSDVGYAEFMELLDEADGVEILTE